MLETQADDGEWRPAANIDCPRQFGRCQSQHKARHTYHPFVASRTYANSRPLTFRLNTIIRERAAWYSCELLSLYAWSANIFRFIHTNVCLDVEQYMLHIPVVVFVQSFEVV